MPTTRILELSSGLRLAIDEDGDLGGTPVFFFHGWPSSRLQGAGFGPAARELGVRLISPDRPGIGLSSYQPGRRLLDWPPLVRETAEQLGIPRFRVLAISGGGPYGVATAFALPDLVETVSIVSGAPPLGPDVDPQAVLPIYRWLLAVHRRRPGAVRAFFAMARPFATIRPPRWMWPLLLRFVPAADREALRDPAVFDGSFGCYREAWRGSARGVASDAEVYAADWGFEPEEVRVPVRLWHGKHDRNFSWRLAEALARRLPDCRTRFIENAGHYSVAVSHTRAILEELISPNPI